MLVYLRGVEKGVLITIFYRPFIEMTTLTYVLRS